MIHVKRTERGFRRGDFVDLYGAECSIQESSLATDDALWLGRDAGKRHHATGQCTARMHLTREMVRELVPLLQHFVETGELPDSGGRSDSGISNIAGRGLGRA